ncbi:MAG: sugar ABC transporter ATP-binding protein, partial [Natronospirillum sp.]
PINLFVAGFMGSPSMNFVRCSVVDHQGEPTIEVMAENVPYYLPIPQQEQAVRERVGQSVILGIRPEQITHVVPHLETGSNIAKLKAEIIVTEPTGADTLTQIRLNEQDVNCRIHPMEAGVAGDQMMFMLDMDKAVFFDPDTENRI